MQSIHALVLMHEGDQYMSRASIRNIKLLSGDVANVPGMGNRWDEGHTRSGLFFRHQMSDPGWTFTGSGHVEPAGTSLDAEYDRGGCTRRLSK